MLSFVARVAASRGRYRHYDSDVIVRGAIHDAACSFTLLHCAEAAIDEWVKKAAGYPYFMGLFFAGCFNSDMAVCQCRKQVNMLATCAFSVQRGKAALSENETRLFCICHKRRLAVREIHVKKG